MLIFYLVSLFNVVNDDHNFINMIIIKRNKNELLTDEFDDIHW